MIKTLFILIVSTLSFPGLVSAQKGQDKPVVENGKLWGILPLEDGNVTYVDIVNCDNKTKQEIFRRARLWMVRNFKANNNAVYVNDFLNGELAFNASAIKVIKFSKESVDIPLELKYTLILECRDNKYKVQLQHIKLNRFGEREQYIEFLEILDEKRTRILMESVHKELQALLTSLSKAVIEYKDF